MSSLPGMAIPSGYTCRHTLLRLPDLPFISPPFLFLPDTAPHEITPFQLPASNPNPTLKSTSQVSASTGGENDTALLREPAETNELYDGFGALTSVHETLRLSCVS